MQKHILILLIVALQIVGTALVDAQPLPKNSAEQRADLLLKEMTLDEKVAQTFCLSGGLFINNNEIDTIKLAKALEMGMGGIRDYFVTDERNSVRINNWIQRYLATKTRLKIPVIVHGEGLHGYVNNNATSFPQAIALASTWNLDLLSKVYAVTAAEARSRGVQQLLSPVLDVVRDPRWGRYSETFGEDPYLTGEIGVQIVKSYQGENQDVNNPSHVMATLKHFPGFGTTEGGLNVAPMVTTERDFRETFLYPFKQAVTRGKAMSIMPSYGEYDGIPTHSNSYLLHDVLRKQWGFKGMVVSDYYAVGILSQGWIWEFNKHQVAKDSIQAAQLAITAGVNVEMIVVECYSALKDLVKNGKVPESVLDSLVKETLICKFKLGLFENPYNDAEKAVEVSDDVRSREIALEAAKEGIIMLKNDRDILPVNPAKYKNIAIIGPNAKDTILGDYSTLKPKYFVSVYDGIKERAGKDYNVMYSEGCKITPPIPEYAEQLKEDEKRIEKAVAVAKKSDIIFLVVGGNVETDREGRDRSDLQMLGYQKELIMRICELGKPVVLCLFGGKLYAMPEIYDKTTATFLCWNLGQETGTALASAVFGDHNPSGKLTVSIPVSTGHLPNYYNRKPTAYGRSYFYEKYIGGTIYPFGFGLSYSTFKISNVRMEKDNIQKDDSVKVFADITNTGEREGAEVVQLYLRDIISSVTRPMKQLKDFQKVFLKPGETKKVSFLITPEKLSFYDRNMDFIVESGDFEVMVGNSSRDEDLKKINFTVR